MLSYHSSESFYRALNTFVLGSFCAVLSVATGCVGPSDSPDSELHSSRFCPDNNCAGAVVLDPDFRLDHIGGASTSLFGVGTVGSVDSQGNAKIRYSASFTHELFTSINPAQSVSISECPRAQLWVTNDVLSYYCYPQNANPSDLTQTRAVDSLYFEVQCVGQICKEGTAHYAHLPASSELGSVIWNVVQVFESELGAKAILSNASSGTVIVDVSSLEAEASVSTPTPTSSTPPSPPLPSVGEPCANIDLRHTPVGTICTTSAQVRFKLVRRTALGNEVWQDLNNNIVWSNRLHQRARFNPMICTDYSTFDARGNLSGMSFRLPTGDDFQLAETHRIREVFNGIGTGDYGSCYFSSSLEGSRCGAPLIYGSTNGEVSSCSWFSTDTGQPGLVSCDAYCVSTDPIPSLRSPD